MDSLPNENEHNMVSQETKSDDEVLVSENILTSNGPNSYTTSTPNVDNDNHNNNNNDNNPNDNHLVSNFSNFGNHYINLNEGIRRPPDGQDYIIPNFWDFERKLKIAYILWFFLGWIGAHQLYNRRYAQMFLYWGHVWFITQFMHSIIALGIFLIPYIIMIILDGVRMKHYVQLANSSLQIRHQHSIQLYDIYQFWYIPFGIFGFHHFYMRNYWKFFAYFFTFGILGYGWLSDVYNISHIYFPLIQQDRKKPFWRFTGYHKKNVSEMWLTWIPFSGVLGIHQFYAGDIYLGLCYILSFGLWGFGWFKDLFRINNYIDHYNSNIEQQVNEIKNNMNNLNHGVQEEEEKKEIEENKNENEMLKNIYLQVKRPKFAKTNIDAYMCWLSSLGFLGLHHLYLQDWFVFLLHMFSLSGCGLMWIVDLFLLPSFVQYSNKRLNLITPDEPPKMIQNIMETHKHKITNNINLNIVTASNENENEKDKEKETNNDNSKPNEMEQYKKNRTLYITYLLWCPLWGWIGLYYLYLQQYKTFCLRFFTFNFLLIGWIIDVFRIPYLVRDYLNRPLHEQHDWLIDNL